MTHKELVERGLRWLEGRCTFALAEIVTIAGEAPDGYGWGAEGSILIECKASRSDFLADAKKHFRRRPENGMGNCRYYLCTPGLISAEELPESWGLLYCLPKIVKVVVKARCQEANLEAERTMLASVIRRCAIRWPLREIQDVDTMPKKTGGNRKDVAACA